MGHFHALEGLGLVGEVQAQRQVQNGFAGLPLPLHAVAAHALAYQEIDAGEGDEHQKDEKGGHGSLLGGQGFGFGPRRRGWGHHGQTHGEA